LMIYLKMANRFTNCFNFMRQIFILFFILTAAKCSFAGVDTLTVMYYNILNYHIDKLPYYRTIIGYSKPDVILLNEVVSDTASIAMLNAINESGICNYAKARFTNGPDKDNMLFYNTDKLVLALEDSIPTDLRLINRYLLYHKNTDTDTVFMDFYCAHLKGSSGITNAIKRYFETKQFTNYLERLAVKRNVFYGGDLNFYNYETEPACVYLIDSSAIKFFDPINSLGNWHDNPTFASIHTQSTRTISFGGGATGGLDDRFDFIFVTEDILNGMNRVKYIENSYMALGNDGQRLNMSLINEPLSEELPDSVTYALYYSSDHLPVIMKITVEVGEMAIMNKTENNLGELIDIEVYNISGRLIYKGIREKAPNIENEILLIRNNYQFGVVNEKTVGLFRK
jgi:exonuclease III